MNFKPHSPPHLHVGIMAAPTPLMLASMLALSAARPRAAEHIAVSSNDAFGPPPDLSAHVFEYAMRPAGAILPRKRAQVVKAITQYDSDRMEAAAAKRKRKAELRIQKTIT